MNSELPRPAAPDPGDVQTRHTAASGGAQPACDASGEPARDPRDDERDAAESRLFDQYWQELRRGDAAQSALWRAQHVSPSDTRVVAQLDVLELLHVTRKSMEHSPEPPTRAAPTAAASESQMLPSGTRLAGKLRILDLIDAGGMGEVYLAWHEVLQCKVAVKVLPGHLASDQRAVEQFRKGIEVQAKIRNHPNIISTLDAGEDQGHVFLVMDYVQGVNLAEFVRRFGPRHWQEALTYVQQAAIGLEHAHRKGIVHRDVKPSNLVLGVDGTVRVLDWGLARLAAAGWHAPGEANATAMPALGTYDYMAPEQVIDAQQATAASDLYSLGATLYFLLIGQPPFAHRILPREKLQAHCHEPAPSIQPLRPNTPPAVDRLLQQLLAKDPGKRHGSARELTSHIARVLGNSPNPNAADRSSSLIVAGLVLVAVLISGLLVAMIRWPRPSRPVTKASTVLTEAGPQVPPDLRSLFHRAEAELEKGNYDAATQIYDDLLQRDPQAVLALAHRGLAHSSRGSQEPAFRDYEAALGLAPATLPFYIFNDYAWLLATTPLEGKRDGRLAVQMATRACELTQWRNPNTLNTLAAACAAANDFPAAVKWQAKAVELAPSGIQETFRISLEKYRRSDSEREGPN